MRVFVSSSNEARGLVQALERALHDRGDELLSPWRIQTGVEWAEQLSHDIRSSDATVALVGQFNANVLYELGLAAGAGKPVLIATVDQATVPFDVATTPYLRLEGDPEEDARAILRELDMLSLKPPTRVPTFDSAVSGLRALAESPELADLVSPRAFEELLQRYFRDLGYDVRTETTTDLGYNFSINGSTENAVVLVQAKKYRSDSRVSLDRVRALAGTVSSVGAAGGLLVTTAGVTAAASELADRTSVMALTLDTLLARGWENAIPLGPPTRDRRDRDRRRSDEIRLDIPERRRGDRRRPAALAVEIDAFVALAERTLQQASTLRSDLETIRSQARPDALWSGHATSHYEYVYERFLATQDEVIHSLEALGQLLRQAAAAYAAADSETAARILGLSY